VTATSRDNLREQLRRREFAPAYLLYGPETYLRDRAARTIVDRAFDEGDLRDFNDTAFSLAGDSDLRTALAGAQQLPVMASRRVVRITDVRISASGYRDTMTDADEAVLTAYLADPSPTSIVIFVADELNGVRKLAKLLKTKTSAVEFEPLDDEELAKWARETIEEAGAEADAATVRYLVERVGPDVRSLTNEINKVAAAALPAKTITTELIDALVPNSREITNFALTDHLVAGRKQAAMAALQKVLDDGVEPLALLGLISYNYHGLMIAKEMMSRGASAREIAAAAKRRYDPQNTFLNAARRADRHDLARAMQRIAEADLAIKTSRGGSGPAASRMQIEMLVCELAAL
jgi:DNA polymerase-3 subunit delta